MDTERLPGGHSQHGDDAIRMGIGPHCHLCWRSQRCVQHGLGIDMMSFEVPRMNCPDSVASYISVAQLA